MLSAAHTIISLPLGIYLNNPIIIFIFAFLLHFVADALLHWNIYPQDYPRFPYVLVALDILGGLILAYLIVGKSILTLPLLAAIAGGNMPDILHSLWLIAGGERHPEKWPRWVNASFAFHHKIQRETHNIVRGLISQIILALLAILLVLTR